MGTEPKEYSCIITEEFLSGWFTGEADGHQIPTCMFERQMSVGRTHKNPKASEPEGPGVQHHWRLMLPGEHGEQN